MTKFATIALAFLLTLIGTASNNVTVAQPGSYRGVLLIAVGAFLSTLALIVWRWKTFGRLGKIISALLGLLCLVQLLNSIQRLVYVLTHP